MTEKKGKRVLIVTCYWPPSGGSGVQRWVKFTKYLPEFDWTPLIYTPENPEVPAVDESLEKDLPANLVVLKTPILEPYSLYKKLTGEKRVGVGFIREKKRRFFPDRLFKWIRGNFFIPDARKFWIRPSVRHLSDYLSENRVDVLVTTGPPHSMHLIGLELKRKFGIPWLADFRDPWTNIDFVEELKLTKRVKRKHQKLEQKVLLEADRVSVVSPTMKRDMEVLSGRTVDLLTNGFDPDDFPLPESSTGREQEEKYTPGFAADTPIEHTSYRHGGALPGLTPTFTIMHTGMMSESRNPHILWKILAGLIEDHPEFRKDLEIRLIGPVDVSVLDSVESCGLKPYLSRTDYLDHSDVVRCQQQARLLLLVLNDSPNARCLLPAKLFEYMASRRPIFSVGPKDGDVRDIMNLSEEYFLAGPGYSERDFEAGTSFILDRYRRYKNGSDKTVDADIHSFSRLTITRKLDCLLNEMML